MEIEPRIPHTFPRSNVPGYWGACKYCGEVLRPGPIDNCLPTVDIVEYEYYKSKEAFHRNDPFYIYRKSSLNGEIFFYSRKRLTWERSLNINLVSIKKWFNPMSDMEAFVAIQEIKANG